MAKPYTFCHYCGARYAPESVTADSHVCVKCKSVTWHNPVPVSVMLQPVYRLVRDGRYPRTELGLLAGRRNINPRRGEYGLPGGFVNLSDPSYEQAALREKREEIRFAAAPSWPGHSAPKLLFSLPGDPGQILSFVEAVHAIPEFWLESFLPCAECDATKVIWEPEPLCFESHTEAARRWLSDRGKRYKGDHLGMAESQKRYYASQKEIQDSCEHEWVDAPELYNYHKREDFVRCTKCELTR